MKSFLCVALLFASFTLVKAVKIEEEGQVVEYTNKPLFARPSTVYSAKQVDEDNVMVCEESFWSSPGVQVSVINGRLMPIDMATQFFEKVQDSSKLGITEVESESEEEEEEEEEEQQDNKPEVEESEEEEEAEEESENESDEEEETTFFGEDLLTKFEQ